MTNNFKIATVRKYNVTVVLLILAGIFYLNAGFAQISYAWNQTGTASFTTSTNWTPNRVSPANTDILVFNNGANTTVTGIGSQTIGQLLVSGNTIVNLQATNGNRTLTISGGTGTDLSVASGSQLNINGANNYEISLSTGATGSITGNMTFTNQAHRLLAADANGITFSSPSVFSASTGFTGSAFGTSGTNNTVIFASGSTYVSAAGANPFGSTAPNSKVLFQTGSLFRMQQNAAPAFNGRTYANFEVNFAGFSQPVTGTSGVTFDNLTVTLGTLNVNTTGTAAVTIKGNISVAAAQTLTFTPASASTLTFAGTLLQTVSNSGTLTFATNEAIKVSNTTSPVGVLLNNAVTFGGALTVDASCKLATAATLTTTSGATINGTFQINDGGFAQSGTWAYGSNGILLFNRTASAFGVSGTPVFWGIGAGGPNNVTVQGGFGINMSIARTVPASGTTGTFLLVTGTNAVQGTALTLNGTTQINGGNFQTTPSYGPLSTLVYNTTYGTSNEWTGGATVGVTAGVGIPANVTVQSGTLTLAGGRGVPGNITVNNGNGFELNAGAGDLYIGGNLTNNGSTWTNNNRAVFFVGTGTQTITAGSGLQIFDYLVLDKSGGSVQLASATNVTINSTAGDVLQILNAGTLDLNGRTVTLNNPGGNILASGGARTITSSVANGLIDITGAKTITSLSGGTLSFGSNVTIAISNGVDFGAAISTINGTLRINTGGSCSVNSPTYGSSSTLVYNTTYGTFNEWTGGATVGVTAGVGIPANVTVQSGTLTLAGGRGVPGNITVNSGNGFELNAVAGDLYIGGNLTNNGSTWTNNNRAVFFVGTGIQTITAGSGTQIFDYLVLDKSGGSVQLASATNVTINSTAGDVLQILNAGTLDLNGRTVTLNNPGGNILASGGARTVTSSVANGLIDITGAKTITSLSGGTLSFGSNVTIAISTGVDFGAALSTINGTLRINTGGSCSVNSPGYGSGSTLIYNTGNFTTSNEWIAGGTVGTGVPSNITLTLTPSTDAVTLTGSRTVPGTLTLTTGDVVIGSNVLTAATINRTSGNLQGSNTSELVITGTGSNLFFNSSGTNNILKNLTLNNSATAALGNDLNITAYDGVSSEGVLTVTGTATLTTGGFLAIKSNANGTARIAAGRTTGGYISGNVSVERFIPQNSIKQWRLLASTTSGQNINQAWQEGVVGSGSNPNPGFGTMITAGNAITNNLATAQAAGFDALSLGVSLFKYNSTTDNLDLVPATNTGNIANEHGYFLFIRGDRSALHAGAAPPTTSTVLRSKGSLFLGDQTAVSTGASNFGLVRNPYPSRIDMRNIVRGGNLVDAYQVWDSKLGGSYGVGGFQTFTKSGANYVVAPGGGSYGANGSVNNVIESGTSFFIQSSGGSGTAQVTEACKTNSSSNNSYRPSGVLADDRRLSFTVYALNPGSTDVVDGGLVFFNDTYSNSVTIEDVRKSGNFNENFGILRENIDLVVEKRKDIIIKDSVFFKMYQLRQISYRIDFDVVNFDPTLTTAILEDKFLNTSTPVSLSALTSYTFTVNATAGSFAQDRFRLVLTASPNTFSGTGNWTDNARWSRNIPPIPAQTVIIASGANATLDTDFTVSGSLTMNPTSNLEVNPGKTLTVSGSADFAAQSVTFKSDETGYGSLGQVTGTLNGASNVTVERYIRNNNFRSWRLLSVPTFGNGQTIRQAWQEGNANPLPLQNNLQDHGTQITGVFTSQAAATAAGFDSTSVQASLLTWNGTGWSNVITTNQPIANNKAYFLFVRGERSKGVTGTISNSSATTLRTNGTVYTGNQVVNVPTGGFAVVANTYPSAISFTGLTRNNVNNLFYVWDSKKQNGSSLGVYQTFSATNSFNCLVSGGSYILGQPNTVIESGQAFFVTGGSTAGGGTVTLLESAKVSGTNGNLGFRPSALPAKIDSRLLDANKEVLDANVVVFDKAFNKEVDADDAVKFGNPGANFAIECNNKLLAIEGRQPVSVNDVIQFRMWNLKQQNYKLEFAPVRMNLDGLYAILEDKYLGVATEIDIKSTTGISFTVDNNPASSEANRFRIVFSKTKPAAAVDKPAYTISPNPAEGNKVNLQFKNQPAGVYNITLITMDGKIVATRIINHAGGSANNVIMLPASAAAGNYQLEIISPQKTKIVKQLLVNK